MAISSPGDCFAIARNDTPGTDFQISDKTIEWCQIEWCQTYTFDKSEQGHVYALDNESAWRIKSPRPFYFTTHYPLITDH